jgi:hypothetical protein
MQLSWRQCFHQLQVKSDSKIQVDMITWKVKINGNPPTLVHCIQGFLKLNWQMHFNHTWREGNRSVDWLANFSFSLDSFNIYVIETPSRKTLSLPFDVIYGTFKRRNIRVSSSFFSFMWPWALALFFY